MKDATLRQASKILSLFEDTPGERVQALIASGFIADLRDGDIAGVKRDDFRRWLGLIPLTPAPEPLFEFLRTATIPATTEQFIVKDKFVVDTKRTARVKISWLGGNFKVWFLGKTEAPTAEATLRYAKLLRSSVDAPILTELGDTAETTLSQIFWLMEQQPNGERGTLLNDGRANIFYVLDATGVLRAVRTYWGGVGWGASAYAVVSPLAWDDGYRVFSRNSSVTVAA